MKTVIRFLLVVGAFLSLALPAYPQQKAPYRDNVYKLLIHVSDFRDGDESDASEYQAGPGSRFKIIAIDDHYTKIRFMNVRQGLAPKSEARQVVLGFVFKIENAKFKNHEQYEIVSGLNYGAMVVPFKYRHEDGAVTGDSTLGGYVGYWQKWLSVESVVFVSIGIARISTVDVNSGTEDYKSGLTWAAGIFFPLEDAFQVGLMAGRDHLGGESGKNWKYEDDTWYTVGIGYKFAL